MGHERHLLRPPSLAPAARGLHRRLAFAADDFGRPGGRRARSGHDRPRLPRLRRRPERQPELPSRPVHRGAVRMGNRRFQPGVQAASRQDQKRSLAAPPRDRAGEDGGPSPRRHRRTGGLAAGVLHDCVRRRRVAQPAPGRQSAMRSSTPSTRSSGSGYPSTSSSSRSTSSGGHGSGERTSSRRPSRSPWLPSDWRPWP